MAARLKLADDTRRAVPMRLRLTIAAIRDTKPPASGERWIHDEGTDGLAVRIYATGRKVYTYTYRTPGTLRLRRMQIGNFPAVTLEQARRKAKQWAAFIADGQDPAEERDRKRKQSTLTATWEAYRDDHLKPKCSPKTLKTDTSLFGCHLKKFHKRKLDDIKAADVKALHSRIGKTAETSANNAVRLLRRLINHAINHHGYTGENPTKGVEMFDETPRERFMDGDEIAAFLAACDAEGQPWADFFRLALATAARRTNLQMMQWAHINTGQRVWTIPASEAKAGKAIRVPLTGPALAILERRKNEQAMHYSDRIRASDYVFPVLRDKGTNPYIGQPARPFHRILKRAGIEDLTVHDLRRTAGAVLAAQGVSLPIIGKVLGHTDLRATQIYARLDLGPVRDAMERASAGVFGAMTADDAKRTDATTSGDKAATLLRAAKAATTQADKDAILAAASDLSEADALAITKALYAGA